MYIAIRWMDARKLGKTGNLHVTNAVARILPNHDLGEAFDALVVIMIFASAVGGTGEGVALSKSQGF